jgi:hypothetical protein
MDAKRNTNAYGFELPAARVESEAYLVVTILITLGLEASCREFAGA